MHSFFTFGIPARGDQSKPSCWWVLLQAPGVAWADLWKWERVGEGRRPGRKRIPPCSAALSATRRPPILRTGYRPRLDVSRGYPGNPPAGPCQPETRRLSALGPLAD